MPDNSHDFLFFLQITPLSIAEATGLQLFLLSHTLSTLKLSAGQVRTGSPFRKKNKVEIRWFGF